MRKRKQILLLFCFSLFIFGQAQVSKTINVTTPGTLGTLLTSNELSTVTNLTITGYIDARDFKAMRDSMTVLSTIDLNAVTISGYNGTKGTDIYGGQIYLANTIPQFSFYKGSGIGKTTLTSINLPNTAISIGMNAFEYCIGLTAITIPNSITAIGSAAFMQCSALESIKLPNSLTSIENYTFYFCTGLKTIIIPNSVTTIGESAFQYCSGFADIIIPNSVTSIKKNAFESCTFLTTITVPNSLSYVGDNALGNTSLFKNEPDGVIYVGKCAYMYKGGAQITNSNITIADGTIQICYCAFYNCSDMSSITIPNTVKSIGYKAFYKCSSLTNITIPSSVDSIGENAFETCIGLKSLNVNTVIPPKTTSGAYTFLNVDNKIPLTVPQGSLSAYKIAFGWSVFNNIQETTSAIDEVSSTTYSIHSQGKKIMVENASNSAIQIVDISGRKVVEVTKASQNEIFVVPTAGIYVVKVGEKSTKVSVK